MGGSGLLGVRSSRAVKLAREWLGDPVFGGVIIGGGFGSIERCC